jgi:hypothetical protein
MWNDTHRRILDPLSFPVFGVLSMLECSPRRCLLFRLRPPPESRRSVHEQYFDNNILRFLPSSSGLRFFVTDTSSGSSASCAFREKHLFGTMTVLLPQVSVKRNWFYLKLVRVRGRGLFVCFSGVFIHGLFQKKNQISSFSVRIFPSLRYIKIT